MAKDDDPEILGSDDSRELVPSKKQSARSVAAAVAMKIRGATYVDIAETLEYTSPAAARAAVEQGLADSFETKDTASLRRITSARLEALWRLAWKNAEKETVTRWRDDTPYQEANPDQDKWVRLGMDISGRYAKLHGLDAPTQVTISPVAEEFNETVQLLVAASRKGQPQEADIFSDEEIVDAVIEEGDLDG